MKSQGESKANETKARLLRVGMVFHGYFVMCPIAVGGFGEVWLVHHSILRTKFAVKVVSKAALSDDPEVKRRFFAEARLAAAIRHPALLAVYDAGQDEETGLFFCVMDYMSNGTLADRLEKRRRLSVSESVRIARTVAEGLADLWRRGIVHRDVKPSNILIAEDGSVKLSDLGIALETSSEVEDGELPNFTLGTPLYMSKEQIMNVRAVDCRADVYSLGVTLYEMLTGKCPGYDLSVDDLFERRVSDERLPSIATVNKAIPKELVDIVERMTEPDIKQRMANPAEVVDALVKFGSKSAARHVFPMAGALLLTIAIVVGAAVLGLFVVSESADVPNMQEEIEVVDGIEVLDDLSLEDDDDESTAVKDVHVPDDEEVVRIVYVTNVVERVVERPQERIRHKEVRRAIDPLSDSVKANPVAPKVTNVVEHAERHETSSPPKQESLTQSVGGIEVRYPSSLSDSFECLRKMLERAQAEVRTLRGYSADEPVQTKVKTMILLPDSNLTSVYDKTTRSLTIGGKCMSDETRLARLLTNVMTTRADRVREPFADDISEYIRLKVLDAVLSVPGAGDEKIRRFVSEAMALERRYGVCDYNGKVMRYGVSRRLIPAGKVNVYCRGLVFDILERTDRYGDGKVLGEYHRKKRQITSKWRGTSSISASDFVALLSMAYGEDLFGQMRELKWPVSRLDTRVNIGNLPKGEFFGR